MAANLVWDTGIWDTNQWLGKKMLLDAVGTMLSTVASTGTTSTYRLFKTFMPDTPDKVMVLYETGGFPPDSIQHGLDQPTFSVHVRGTYSTAREKLNEAFNLLHQINRSTAGGSTEKFISIVAVGDALSLGRDTKNRPVISQNFRALRERST